MVVRHTCDNPSCIEPSHLLIGTTTDNNRDRQARGRSSDRRGEKCPTAKLTWPEVREIRRRLASGERRTLIADAYGVSRRTISFIATGERWKENPS